MSGSFNSKRRSSGFGPLAQGGVGRINHTGSGRSSRSSGTIRSRGGGRSRGRSSYSSRPRRRLLEGVNQTALSKVLVAAAVLIVLAVGAALIYIAANSSSRQISMSVIDSADTGSVMTAEDAGSTVKIALGGTIKLQDEILAAARGGNTAVYNFDNYLSEVRQVMSADISIVSMMGTISPDDTEVAGYPAPVYPAELVTTLRNMGVTHAVTANKSIMTGGKNGLENTVRALANGDITAVGAYTSSSTGNRVYVKRVNSINIGIAAYNCLTEADYNKAREAERSMGFDDKGIESYINQLSLAEVRTENGKSHSAASDAITEDVKAMRAAGAQFVIICIDWDPITWEFDGRLPDYMTSFAQRLIDIGVDVTVGYGIDVPQRITVKPYTAEDGTTKNCYFFYSLGNLFSDSGSGKNQERQESFVINITLTRNADSRKVDKTDVVYHPMYTLHDKLYENENTYFKYRVVPAMAYQGVNPNGDESLKALVKGCNSTCEDLKAIINSTTSNRNGSLTKTAVKLGVLKTATAETAAAEATGENDKL